MISGLPTHAALAVHQLAPCRVGTSGEDVVHDHAGIGVYLGGRTRVWMSLEYTLTRGDVLLVPEGMPHTTLDSEEGALLGVMLCSSCMRGSWGSVLSEAFRDVRRGRPPVVRLDEATLGQVEQLITTLARELDAPRAAQALMVDGLMAQLVALLTRAARPAIAAGASERVPHVVGEALDYIEGHSARGISLRDVAKGVGRSPAHLATLLKQYTGRSVVAWITHHRMARARELLVASDAGVDAIAAQVGFASPSHFHRTFRKHHELSPSAWRAAHRRSVARG